jgi:hypothetical protein
MVAVAVAALIMGAGVWVAEMRRRSVEYQRQAARFEVMSLLDHTPGSCISVTDDIWVNRHGDNKPTPREVWASKLAEKYRRLSKYPWLTVEPDPPAPE